MRVRMDVEYLGSAYSGWQRQKNAPSVQQCLEEALWLLTGQRTHITGAGRTDAGVHAQCMPCHFDTQTGIPPEKLSFALNHLLPEDIRIQRAQKASDGFHARFDAKAKWYRYRIYMHAQQSALYRDLCWHVPQALRTGRMRRALTSLPGTHDFAAFAASGGKVQTTVRTMYGATMKKSGHWLVLDVLGSGFLYNMVRIIAGTLVDIGRGQCPPDAFETMLQTGQRTRGGMTAPGGGLMLMHVFYSCTDLMERWERMCARPTF